MFRKALVIVLVAVGMVLTGCATQSAAPQATSTAAVTVKDPWVRPAAMAAMNHSSGGMSHGSDTAAAGGVSAAYLTLVNGGSADAVVKAASDVAESVELHTMAMNGDVMEMRPVEQIDLPAGGEVKLAPGGLHVMLIGLKRDLKEGETVKITLTLKSGATIDISAPVRKPM